MAPIFGCIDFPIFALFSKTFEKPTPPTIFVKSSSKSPEMIIRPSQHNFDPHNRLSGTATQIQQKSRQTGSEVICKQIFKLSTPNLVCTWKTLQQDRKSTRL